VAATSNTYVFVWLTGWMPFIAIDAMMATLKLAIRSDQQEAASRDVEQVDRRVEALLQAAGWMVIEATFGPRPPNAAMRARDPGRVSCFLLDLDGRARGLVVGKPSGQPLGDYVPGRAAEAASPRRGRSRARRRSPAHHGCD